ncbi:MAG: hypothetical protein FJ309_17305 [Planctomycetes bacterium]|nr:hypothetical protein [Planctomycetota bacterium]
MLRHRDHPLSHGLILASVSRTGRLLVVDEPPASCGFAAEVAARVADKGFDLLDAPVRRLTGAFVPTPYAPALEAAFVPAAPAARFLDDMRRGCEAPGGSPDGGLQRGIRRPGRGAAGRRAGRRLPPDSSRRGSGGGSPPAPCPGGSARRRRRGSSPRPATAPSATPPCRRSARGAPSAPCPPA